MLIAIINHKRSRERVDKETREELAQHGVNIEEIEASMMSIKTSMRLARICKTLTPDLVIVDRIKDLIAAVSGRELVRKRGKDFLIGYRKRHDETINTLDPITIYKGIDVWLYETTTTRSHSVHNYNTGEVPADEIDYAKGAVAGRPQAMLHVEHTPNKNILTYIGAMGKCENIASIINAIANLDEAKRPEIRICGTGKARYVMPVVKRSQAMGIDIKWLGDDYDIATELTHAGGFILSDTWYDSNEVRALALGIPPVTKDNITEWLNPGSRNEMSEKAIETYRTEHAPEAVAARLTNIITKLRK